MKILKYLKKNMNKFKIFNLLLIFYFIILIPACSKIRESAGVTRRSMDEFQVIEYPPLVIPPDFNIVSPDQLQQKDIENIENELAQEILFGLDNQNTNNTKQLSTMNQILSSAEASNASDNIRDEIDQDFSQSRATKGILQNEWETEIEVLDAVEESQRIRNNIFNEDSLLKGKIPIKKEKKKEVIKKKKKRFIFF